jgi:hypothetical protein
VQPENWNLRIQQAELREARSGGNTKYTVTLGSDGAFGDISKVTTFQTNCSHGYETELVDKEFSTRLTKDCLKGMAD